MTLAGRSVDEEFAMGEVSAGHLSLAAWINIRSRLSIVGYFLPDGSKVILSSEAVSPVTRPYWVNPCDTPVWNPAAFYYFPFSLDG